MIQGKPLNKIHIQSEVKHSIISDSFVVTSNYQKCHELRESLGQFAFRLLMVGQHMDDDFSLELVYLEESSTS